MAFRLWSTVGLSVFQSAPLTEARGDIPGEGNGRNPIEVSIRSPDRSQGRYSDLYGNTDALKFQSAPLTEARGDERAGKSAAAAWGFQSAPLTEARGDVRGFRLRAGGKQVSIRSPDRSQGRYRGLCRFRAEPLQFQSAPLTEARGDPVATCGYRTRP